MAVTYGRTDRHGESVRVPFFTIWLRNPRLIRSPYKYLYGLQVVVPGLADCVCDFSMYLSKCTYDTEITPSERET